MLFFYVLGCRNAGYIYNPRGITSPWAPWQIYQSEYCFLFSLDTAQNPAVQATTNQSEGVWKPKLIL